MLSATFDTDRRMLGLSLDETAQLLSVDRTTVDAWIADQKDIPDSAFEALVALEEAMMNAVDNVVEFATDLTMDNPLVLYRYRSAEDLERSPHAAGMPLGAHAMMLAWTADALADEGYDNVIFDWAP